MENGNFLHYFHSAKTHVIDIKLEIEIKEKETETKYSQTLVNGAKYLCYN